MPREDRYNPVKRTERVLPPDLSKGRKLEIDGIYRPSFKERLLILFGGCIIARATAFTALNPGRVVNKMDVEISHEHDPKKFVLHNRIASYLNVKIKQDEEAKKSSDQTEEVPLPNQN